MFDHHYHRPHKSVYTRRSCLILLCSSVDNVRQVKAGSTRIVCFIGSARCSNLFSVVLFLFANSQAKLPALIHLANQVLTWSPPTISSCAHFSTAIKSSLHKAKFRNLHTNKNSAFWTKIQHANSASEQYRETVKNSNAPPSRKIRLSDSS